MCSLSLFSTLLIVRLADMNVGNCEGFSFHVCIDMHKINPVFMRVVSFVRFGKLLFSIANKQLDPTPSESG
jgi:hypothetical protein